MISGRKGVGAVITQSVNQSGGRDEPTIHPLLQFFNSQLRIIVSGGGGGQFVGWREREREREKCRQQRRRKSSNATTPFGAR